MDDNGFELRMGSGHGPVVLWIHPYTMDSRVWDRLWRWLPGWRHIGIDLPGHGSSRPLASDEQMPDIARKIVDVAKEQGSCHIIGLSFGSTVALEAAIQNPAQFSSLVLGAPAVAGAPPDPAARLRYLQLRSLHAQVGPSAQMVDLWMSSPPDIFRGAQAHPALWRCLEKVISEHTWREFESGAMLSLSAHIQTPADLQRVTARTLVLLGENEMDAFRHCARMVAACVHDTTMRIVPSAGHLCLLEAPDLVAPVIDAHLRRRSRRHSADRPVY